MTVICFIGYLSWVKKKRVYAIEITRVNFGHRTDLTNQEGSKFASGLYLIRAQDDEDSKTAKGKVVILH